MEKSWVVSLCQTTVGEVVNERDTYYFVEAAKAFFNPATYYSAQGHSLSIEGYAQNGGSNRSGRIRISKDDDQGRATGADSITL